jgi:hypothetical protein
MQLFVFCAKFCDFVVWTTKRVHIVSIPFNPSFMSSVCINLEKFWVAEVVPLLLANQLDMSHTGNVHYLYFDAVYHTNLCT